MKLTADASSILAANSSTKIRDLSSDRLSLPPSLHRQTPILFLSAGEEWNAVGVGRAAADGWVDAHCDGPDTGRARRQCSGTVWTLNCLT